MNFLPLVARELRVASRRRITWWLRGGCAVGTLFFMAPALLAGNGGGAVGAAIFDCMAYFACAVCLLMGVVLGADCISSERREGTLGFLFLSDLKGYDVVLGKFCAVSLNAFFGLLAIFPILALSLFAGGVTFGEFWRTCAALLNTLFFSTAFSVFISAKARGSRPPKATALALAGILWVGGLIGYEWAAAAPGKAVTLLLSLASPSVPFLLALDAGYSARGHPFWPSLVFSNAVGWLFLLAAAWRLKIMHDTISSSGFLRRRRRRALLKVNAIAWLLDDSSAVRNVAMLLGMACVLVASFGGVSGTGAWLVVFALIALGLKILFALQACRFFVETRRSGAIEFLACMPVAGKEVIDGQWITLRRTFLLPFCLAAGSGMIMAVEARSVYEASAATFLSFFQLFTLFFDFLAIGWFGMWMGLSMRNPKWAAPVTIVVAVLVPLAILCFPNVLFDLILFAIAQSAVSRWKNPRSRPWEIESRYEWTMVRS